MQKSVVLSAVFLVVLLFSASVQAEIYRYTDDRGELHYVDDLSLVPEKYRKQLKDAKPLPDINVAPPVAAPPVATRPANTPPKPAEEPQKKKEQSASMEVFVTSWCPYCKKLEAFLDSKGIGYTRYDIEKDPAAHKVYKELGGRGVPVTRAGDKVIHGYNPDAILRLVK